MLKGAEVILVPNDFDSMQPRIRALSTRAYENMVAVAMANPTSNFCFTYLTKNVYASILIKSNEER